MITDPVRERAWATRLIRRRQKERLPRSADPLENLHTWVLRLPWVVERPAAAWSHGARLFAVDCTPLGRRRMWLTTGPTRRDRRDDTSVSVVLPAELTRLAEVAGWNVEAPLPSGHVLVTCHHPTDANSTMGVEQMLLAAYSYALS